jgi:hypothetical protein
LYKKLTTPLYRRKPRFARQIREKSRQLPLNHRRNGNRETANQVKQQIYFSPMILTSRITRILQPLLFVLAFIVPQIDFAQAISPRLFGQNAWMPDTIGTNVIYGKLHNKWAKVSESGAKMVRFGGITADRDMPTNYQYIKMIDSIRAKGMEPIIQVSYHNGDHTASQAAQLVQYINVTKGRNVKYWSIGNEPDLEYSFTSAAQVAAYIKPFASAMKAADPNIKIIGPETAWYNQTIINGLTTPGGPNDITGVDNAGRYYVDIISFHTYPFNGTQTRAQLISKLTAVPGFDSNLNALSARVASCNVAHNRTGTNALKTAVTELNVNYQNSSSDNLNGTGVNSFIGGQFVAEMFGLGMKNNVDIMTMWSVIEGNSTALNIGYLDRVTGDKKPMYHHFNMMSSHFSGNYISSVSTQTNVKVFSCQTSSLTTVMIMNQDQSSDFSYAVRLDNSVITATNPLKINVNAGIPQMYYNIIPNQSSVLLQFNAQGSIVKKVTYTIAQALANLSPTVSVYTPTLAQNVVPPVNNTSSTNLNVCSGNTTSLVASSGTNTIKWYASPISTAVLSTGSVFTTPALTVSATSSTVSYYAQASNATTVSARTPVTVTVNPRPLITVNSGSICAGNIFTLSPTGATSYTFSSGTSTVSPASSASYSVTGSNQAGCASASPAVAQVSVIARPVISVNSGSICPGKVFTMIPSGASSYTFSSGTSTVSPSSNTSYSVSGSNTAGCASASPAIAQVAVNALPSVVVNSGSICAGKVFTMMPSGAASYTFSSGSSTVSPATSTSYSVSGTSSAGCVSPASAVATVVVLPNTAMSVNSGSICAGKTFTIVPSGAATYSISGSSFVVSPLSTTAYTVSASSANGCTSTAVSIVSVQSIPVVSVANGTICKGNSFTLLPSGASSYSYSSGSPVVSPNTNTTYSVWGTTGGCVSNPAIAVITVKSRKACEAGLLVTATTLQAAAEPTLAATKGTQNGQDIASATETVAIGSDYDATGISESDNATALSVYPNPNSGEFYIVVGQESSLTIMSITGAVIRSETISAGTTVVNITGMPAGMYVIRISRGDKAEFARVLKQ